MLKKLLAFAASLLLLCTNLPFAFAVATLYEYYTVDLGVPFPSLAQRAKDYKALSSDVYQGTAGQNTQLLAYLQHTPVFGGTYQTPSTAAFFQDSLAAP